MRGLWAARERYIAGVAVAGIIAHLVLSFLSVSDHLTKTPLWAVLALGGVPLVGELVVKALRRDFGSDLLAGISIVTAVLLDQQLAAALVVLMLSGGQAIESFAVNRASSVLRALAARLPSVAHRKIDDAVGDVAIEAVRVGDEIEIYPHEVAPVDGEVIRGHGTMDESYLTGEPYMMAKASGSIVLSGSVNGETPLTVRATRVAEDSRYARIMSVMRQAEENRPHMRRLGDRLGAFYTPIALAIASIAWIMSGEPVRFLAVLVIATPCPLLIAIPVAIIGAISRAARRGIIVRTPGILEILPKVRTVILDKTGTLTYGRPTLTEEHYAPNVVRDDILPHVAALERYSKHPLASAIVRKAEESYAERPPVEHLSEAPGRGLVGQVANRTIEVTGRTKLLKRQPSIASMIPDAGPGLECVILVDGRYAATYRFHDAPRGDSRSFVSHLGPKHRIDRVLLVSGDRESEVRYLAEQVAITEVYGDVSPEGKVAIVRDETSRATTLYVGDGINDAPAMVTASVGVAFGGDDVTSAAAGAVIVDPSLERVDELLHISTRLRRIALQSAVGGMALSIAGMFLAAFGYLTPVAGALAQEGIDLLVVFNALRVSAQPKTLSDL